MSDGTTSLRAGVLALLILMTALPAAGEVSFELLDAPHPVQQVAVALSQDGRNMGCLLDGAVYWWTEKNGFRYLDAGSPGGGGVGMSASGNALAASRQTPSGTTPSLWFRDGSATLLDVVASACPPEDAAVVGYGLNADATLVTGQVDSCETREAFLWSRSGGERRLPAAGAASGGRAMSADGHVVAGFCNHPVEEYRRPVIWRGGEAEFFLGHDRDGEALDISANGRFVVGQAAMGGVSRQAFCWFEGAEPLVLGNLSGRATDSSLAASVSDDGKVVGWSGDEIWGNQEAFIWTADVGMRSLAEVIESAGGQLPEGLKLTGALEISGDGRTVVGVGRDREWSQKLWRARLDLDLALEQLVGSAPRGPRPGVPSVIDTMNVNEADMLSPFPFGKRRF